MKLFDFFKKDAKEKNNIPLWTRPFTILTVGSIVSYMGSAVLTFILGLWVLDISHSVLLYSIYLTVSSLVKIIGPMIAGPYLDRFSRKKVIYTLDYTTAAILFASFALFSTDYFEYWIVFTVAVLLSVIDSVYRVAFTSLFPMTVHPENMPRAYSILSTMEIMSRIMVPVASFLYKSIGIAPVFAICSLSYCIAATIELFIKVDESAYTNTEKSPSVKTYIKDLKEGFSFLSIRKALLFMVICEFLVALIEGTRSTVLLPFFNENVDNGYLWYMVVTGACMTGQFWGSVLLYVVRIPRKILYTVFLATTILAGLLNSSLLLLPVLVMIPVSLVQGIFALSSLNIRTFSVQKHVPNAWKGRYNGVNVMATNLGLITGELLSGALSEAMSLKSIYFILPLVAVIVQIILFVPIGGKRLSGFLTEQNGEV